MTLQAGWARRDITPPIGIHMGGYWGRQSGATAIHDALYARLVAWRCDNDCVVLISLDLVAVDPAFVATVRQAVAARLQTSPEAVMICCTHTHAGPLTLPFRGMGDVDASYLQFVQQQIEAAAAEAQASLSPAQAATNTADVQIGINRRKLRIGEDAGPVAAHAHVMVLTTEAGRAVLFQHACHPVVLGSSNHDISADFPGPACAHIEASGASLAMFLNGAAGDINPRIASATHADVETLGRELGEAVVLAARDAQPMATSTIRWQRTVLSLPLLPPPSRATALAEATRSWLRWMVKRGDRWARMVPRARWEWARDCLQVAGTPQPAAQPFELQGLRIGDVTFVGLEGEIFVDYQLDFEAIEGTQVVLCGFTNGCIGYVPTAEEYPAGGYEVDQAYRVYPSVLMIAPESDGIVRGAVRELVTAL